MRLPEFSPKGFAPILIILAAIGVIIFLFVANIFLFKGKLFQYLFPKQFSHAAGVVVLSALPATISTTTGSTFNVNLSMDTKGESVSAADIKVTFDPLYLQATALTQGTALPAVLKGADLVTPGVATIILGSSPTAPQSGVLSLANVTFKAIKDSPVPVSIKFDPMTQAAAIGKGSVDVLGSTFPTNVTITPIVIPSPTPSPTPVPTPTPSPSPVPPTIIEAEKMNIVSGTIKVFSDSQASALQAMVYLTNGTLSKTFSTTTNTAMILVRARGDQCKGAPTMKVRVDGKQILLSSVSSTTWLDYKGALSLVSGSHTLAVDFTNDLFNNKCDRNLRVDRVMFK